MQADTHPPTHTPTPLHLAHPYYPSVLTDLSGHWERSPAAQRTFTPPQQPVSLRSSVDKINTRLLLCCVLLWDAKLPSILEALFWRVCVRASCFSPVVYILLVFTGLGEACFSLKLADQAAIDCRLPWAVHADAQRDVKCVISH